MILSRPYGDVVRGMQSGPLYLRINDNPKTFDGGRAASMPNAAVNVVGISAMLRDDVHNGKATAPDFNRTVQLNRLSDAVLAPAKQGLRQNNDGWLTTEVDH